MHRSVGIQIKLSEGLLLKLKYKIPPNIFSYVSKYLLHVPISNEITSQNKAQYINQVLKSKSIKTGTTLGMLLDLVNSDVNFCNTCT